LSKEKFDLEVHSNDKAKGLSVTDRSFERGNNSKKNSTSKSKGIKSTKSIIRYLITDFDKLKNKKER